MSILSKLLCEYIITENVNDRLKVQDSVAAWHTVTIPDGRYRDHVELYEQLKIQLDAATVGTGQVWAIDISTAGITAIASDEAWDIDWDVAVYGIALRDQMGYDGTEIVTALALVATAAHEGGFYPTEPVEADDRPEVAGDDRWSSNTYQQQGPTGLVATLGGDQLVYRRSFQFLMPQDDLAPFSVWLERVAQGYSFAYYHDRDQPWPGPESEYGQYKVLADDGGAGVQYNPEPVEPGNRVWHRQQLLATKRVAPTV